MDVLTSETCWALNKEIIKQVTSSLLLNYQDDARSKKHKTTDHIFCIRQIIEKQMEYNEAMHQLFIDFEKAYDSVTWDVLWNILTELKLARLIKGNV